MQIYEKWVKTRFTCPYFIKKSDFLAGDGGKQRVSNADIKPLDRRHKTPGSHAGADRGKERYCGHLD